MPSFIRRKVARTPRPGENLPSYFSVRLHAPALILGGIILLLTLVWAFVVGFLVGRGEDPGEKFAQYNPFSAGERRSATPVPSTGDRNETTPEMKSPDSVSGVGAVNSDEKTSGANDLLAATSGQTSPPPDQSAFPHPFARPKGEGKGAWGGVSADADQKGNGVRQDPSQVTQPSSTEPRFDFLYRIATFSRAEDAASLQKKISNVGKVEVRQKGKFYLVFLRLRGTEADEASMIERLSSMRVKNPLLVSKKALAKTNPARTSGRP
ncbi:MAG: hypothetical protein K5657_04120 [Desulfovibrio sp.]|nr:hypothetical protein [Desulfovibrio sp.]